jgi:hypothetical protein
VRRPDLLAGQLVVQRQVQADQRVGEPDGRGATSSVLRAVRIHGQLVQSHQVTVLVGEADDLVVQGPAGRGGVHPVVGEPLAWGQLHAAAGARLPIAHPLDGATPSADPGPAERRRRPGATSGRMAA